MILWTDIASIVLVCVTANHLGLVKAMEEVVEQELPIINCPKCSSFWWSLVYTLYLTHDIITSLAISCLASYIALWLELLEGYIDTLYLKLYGKIYTTSDDTPATDPDKGYSTGTVPEL
jgi:hypothetical protein